VGLVSAPAPTWTNDPPELALAEEDLIRLTEYRRTGRSMALTLMFAEGVVADSDGAGSGELAKVRLASAAHHREHERRVREVVEEDGDGCVIAALAGSTFCAFRSRENGIQVAQRIQQALDDHNRGRSARESLRVRIGLATGYLGEVTNPRAVARLAYQAGCATDQAGAGEILESTADGLSRVAAAGWRRPGESDPLSDNPSHRRGPIGLTRRRRAVRAVLLGLGLLAYLPVANHFAGQLAPRIKARREKLRLERALKSHLLRAPDTASRC
jgi:hypothetical protein